MNNDITASGLAQLNGPCQDSIFHEAGMWIKIPGCAGIHQLIAWKVGDCDHFTFQIEVEIQWIWWEFGMHFRDPQPHGNNDPGKPNGHQEKTGLKMVKDTCQRVGEVLTFLSPKDAPRVAENLLICLTMSCPTAAGSQVGLLWIIARSQDELELCQRQNDQPMVSRRPLWCAMPPKSGLSIHGLWGSPDIPGFEVSCFIRPFFHGKEVLELRFLRLGILASTLPLGGAAVISAKNHEANSTVVFGETWWSMLFFSCMLSYVWYEFHVVSYRFILELDFHMLRSALLPQVSIDSSGAVHSRCHVWMYEVLAEQNLWLTSMDFHPTGLITRPKHVRSSQLIRDLVVWVNVGGCEFKQDYGDSLTVSKGFMWL